MPAYVIADVVVQDAEAYREYQQHARDTIALYGGRFIVRGGKTETLEGDWRPHRVVMMEFRTLERAKEWYGSPEYQAIIPIRQHNARTHFLSVMEGA